RLSGKPRTLGVEGASGVTLRLRRPACNWPDCIGVGAAYPHVTSFWLRSEASPAGWVTIRPPSLKSRIAGNGPVAAGQAQLHRSLLPGGAERDRHRVSLLQPRHRSRAADRGDGALEEAQTALPEDDPLPARERGGP